jgi:hypothetical protein
VSGWAGHLREIATEEMGHFLTVQNLLLAIKAEPHLDRLTPAASEVEPLSFRLERFGLPFVSRFMVAESPLGTTFTGELRKWKKQIEHVGVLYAMLVWLFQESDVPDPADPEGGFQLPPDLGFPEGRHLEARHFADPAALVARINAEATWFTQDSHIHVRPNPADPATPLTDARNIARAVRIALADIAVQGEGPVGAPESAPKETSHYHRLRAMFNGLKAPGSEPPPVYKVPEASHTDPLPGVDPAGGAGLITEANANLLARALDKRYAILIQEIAIAVSTLNADVVNGENLLQRVAGWAVWEDMVGAISASAQLLVTLPLKAGGSAETGAGPPFSPDEGPLPTTPRGRWGRLIDLLDEFAAVARQAEASSVRQDVRDLVLRIAAGDAGRAEFARAVLEQLPTER